MMSNPERGVGTAYYCVCCTLYLMQSGYSLYLWGTPQSLSILYYFVGLPKPVNLRMINFTNASITLTWEYPPPPFEAIESFLVYMCNSQVQFPIIIILIV